MSDQHDVIIAGAGPAGSALAYFLARDGWDVLLIDKADFPRDKTCGDGLTPRALGVLRTMGALDQVTAAGRRINGLRFDFPSAQLAFPGLMLVGETAGLVNPLTGEGIDYALESAEVAAEGLLEALRHESTPAQAAQAHTRALRHRFQRSFQTISWVRDFYLRPWLLNRTASAAAHHADFCQTLVQVCLGNVNPAHGLSPRMIWQIAFG